MAVIVHPDAFRPQGQPGPTKRYYKLSPELVDGDHWTVVETLDEVFDAIREWGIETLACPGEGFSVEIVDLTDEDVAAIPEI